MQWQFTFIAASQPDKDGDDPACHGLVHDVDVGALFRQKTAFKSLNQAEKLNIINNHFRPGEDYAFPKVFMNGCNRSFQRSWQQRYPWLVYSKECDGGFCLPCVLFAIRESLCTLVTTPFNRWIKVSKVCGEHEKNRYHIDAMVAYDNFLTTSRNPQKNIQVQIESERGSTIKRNRQIVKSVAKCVHFCGKQCIALRGHRDDSTADQNGNRATF